MPTEYNYLKWIVYFPLIGFFINFTGGKKFPKKFASYLASTAILFSFIFSLKAFLDLIKLPDIITYKDFIYNWIILKDIVLEVALRFDNLSAVMALMVSGVSFLIHIYSIEYMHDDKDFNRFFSYLNLFVFFMLLLVLSDNIILLFVGWEGVGLCSYLLIGFWYENIENSKAAKKAFITNRVGDAFFIIGFLTLSFILVSNGIIKLDFDTINKNVDLFKNTLFWGVPAVTLITVLLFTGATGKSAQFPLYVWLPDAMAGPTPVSALIHAATMVTAGIYMIVRLFPLFSASPFTMDLILYIAAFTSLFSAIIAVTQTDIKKILAYSTISQLGYMFMGVASGVYQSGMFHLLTHAFFKALLFLGAGAVIHALSGEQNIFNMGGLKDSLKKVFIFMAVAWLSISGLPFLSGYFSKDFIIENIYLSGHKYVWFVSVITAGLTAFYMTRLMNIAFFRKPKQHHHIHQPGNTMNIPLYVLAFLSVISGFYIHSFNSFLGLHEHHIEISAAVKYLPLIFAIVGILLGFYLTSEHISDMLESKFKKLHTLVLNKFYVDEIYYYLVIKPLHAVSRGVFDIIDRLLIDNVMVERTAKTFYTAGKILGYTQNSKIHTYAIYMLAGIITALVVLLRSL